MSEELEQVEQVNTPAFDLDGEFEKSFGMPLSEAQQAYNQNLIINTLGENWDVSPKTVKARIAEVTTYVQKLPEDQQAAFDSIEGVQAAYEQMTAKAAEPTKPSTTGLFGFGSAQKTSAPKGYREIDPRADVAAYQAAIFDEMKREGLI
jgi:hypothetical protein